MSYIVSNADVTTGPTTGVISSITNGSLVKIKETPTGYPMIRNWDLVKKDSVENCICRKCLPGARRELIP